MYVTGSTNGCGCGDCQDDKLIISDSVLQNADRQFINFGAFESLYSSLACGVLNIPAGATRELQIVDTLIAMVDSGLNFVSDSNPGSTLSYKLSVSVSNVSMISTTQFQVKLVLAVTEFLDVPFVTWDDADNLTFFGATFDNWLNTGQYTWQDLSPANLINQFELPSAPTEITHVVDVASLPSGIDISFDVGVLKGLITLTGTGPIDLVPTVSNLDTDDYWYAKLINQISNISDSSTVSSIDLSFDVEVISYFTLKYIMLNSFAALADPGATFTFYNFGDDTVKLSYLLVD